MRAIVAERGQVTIPKELRVRLGIKPGTVLDFVIEDSKLVAEKDEDQDPVAKVYGCLTKKVNTDEEISKLRGE
jgi:antitoxin PrlF